MTNAVRTIADKFGLRKSGNRFIGVCPSCSYADALVVQDGHSGPLIYCHACRDPKAVWLALRGRGVMDARHREKSQSSKQGRKSVFAGMAAFKIWANARNAVGTPVETYLR